MKIKQRKDLDSLRGIAVLSVVLFHLNSSYFKNGHFGVDIFFVLSGYFIFTSHCLMPDRPLFEFFEKRIWRIFPGYFVFLSLTSVATYYLLIPSDFMFYVEEARKAACFVSNFQFETEKGYWDRLQEHFFVLHTWSLSVEIQFYICSAAVAFILKRAGNISVCLLVLVSMASHYFVSENMAFYSLPCRIWQFLFGFVAIQWQQKKNSNLPSYLALPTKDSDKSDQSNLMKAQLHKETEKNNHTISSQQIPDYIKTVCAFLILLICMVSYYDELLFVQRTLITSLACYIVSSDSTDFHNIDLIWNNKILQFFGEISYSWYLWHWPFSVGSSYFEASIVNNPISLLIYAAIPLCLASLSTYFIERPLLRMNHGKMSSVALSIIPSLLFLCATTVFLNSSGSGTNQGGNLTNVTSRFNPQDPNLLRVNNKWSHCWDAPLNAPCVFGDPHSEKTTVIWGDSHGMLGVVAHTFLPQVLNNSKLSAFIRHGCRPFLKCKYDQHDYANCRHDTPIAFKELRALKPKRVILMARYIVTYRIVWNELQKNSTEAKKAFEECQMTTIREIMDMGVKEIVMVHAIPQAEQLVPEWLEKSLKFGWNLNLMHIDRHKHEQDTADLHETFENIKANCPICSSLDPATILCDRKICPVWIPGPGNTIRPLYRDDQHLNDYGMEKFAPLFSERKWWDII